MGFEKSIESLSQAWLPIEHEVWKKIKKHKLDRVEQFILAVSGGIDSMVLLNIMVRLKPAAEFIVAHFHHGESQNENVSRFRDQSSNLVKKTAETMSERGIRARFATVKHKGDILQTESEFRSARINFLNQLQKQNPEAVLVTGHQQNDLLETWLLKMIRGTGAEGLENFKFWNQKVLRPLLYLNKNEIVTYAEHNNLQWVDDPSNDESVFLRNWLRNDWLPQLEQKQPGSLKNMTLSLARLLNDIEPGYSPIEIIYSCDFTNSLTSNVEMQTETKAQFSRTEYAKLDYLSRLKVLAVVLKRLNCEAFSQNQLEEIDKRLDKNQKELTFSVAGANWVINAQQVVVHL